MRWLSYENKVNCSKQSSHFLITFWWTLLWCFFNWESDDIYFLHVSHLYLIPKWTILVWFFKWSFLLNKLPHSSHLKDLLSWWTSLIWLLRDLVKTSLSHFMQMDVSFFWWFDFIWDTKKFLLEHNEQNLRIFSLEHNEQNLIEPSCTSRTCLLRLYLEEQIVAQSLHLNFRPECLDSMWCFKPALSWYLLSHLLQSKNDCSRAKCFLSKCFWSPPFS